jgi:hypothetical protein
MAMPDDSQIVLGLNAAREMASRFVREGIAHLAEAHPELHDYVLAETTPPGIEHLARAEHTTPCLACARKAGPGTVLIKHE